MIFVAMISLLASCSEPATEEEPEPEKKEKKKIECIDACKMIQADQRKGPPFIQFHWKNEGNPEYQRCFKEAISDSKFPKEMQCEEKALAKCETSCKKMTEREHK